MGSLTITYQAPGQRPLSIATVEDATLLKQAAQLALEQAEQHAAVAAADDPIMGMLQAAELRRLREALSILVPGLRASHIAAADVQ
jgi:hypothetical protein